VEHGVERPPAAGLGEALVAGSPQQHDADLPEARVTGAVPA
jgi:hypothetical protein